MLKICPIIVFLAAMSSSRSDDVNSVFVCLSVCSHFFLFMSLEFYLVLKSFKCLKKVLRALEVSRVFQESFEDVSSKFSGCLRKNLKEV